MARSTSPRSGPWSRRGLFLRGVRRGLLRRTAVVLLVALITAVTADPAVAVSERMPTPELRIPGAAGLVGLLTGKPKPDWGTLPRQRSGTAAGRPHRVSADATRAGKGTGHRPKPGKGELPAYKPLERKVPKGKSGQAGNVGYVARTSKRVAGKSSETSDYFTNADGSYTRVLHPGPTNYRDPSGRWQPIDTDLEKVAGGRLAEKANSVDVDFAPSAADPALVRLSADDHTVSYGLQGAASVVPSVSGAIATYRGVLPGTDLELEPTAAGMKESLVLRSKDAANSWVFPLKAEGLTAAVAKDGAIEMRDGGGRLAMRIPPGYAVDSKVDPRSGEPATSYAVSYRLIELDAEPAGRAEPGAAPDTAPDTAPAAAPDPALDTAPAPDITPAARKPGGQALQMTLDPAWLRAKERVFPVTVDPSITLKAVTTYAETGIPAGDHSNGRTIKVGSWDAGPHSAKSFLQFPGAGLDGSGATVSAASLRLFNTWASICTPQRFDVALVTKAWTPSSVTSYPGPTHGSSIGNLTPNVPNACANTAADRKVGDWVTVPLTASAINGWAQGTSKDYGLAMYAATNDNLHWKQFDSVNNVSYGPSLILTYTGQVLPQIKVSAPPSGHASPTLTPELTALGSVDPNLGVSTKYLFQVFDSASTKIVESGLTTAQTWTVPSGLLEWGESYYWTVQAYDGTNYSPDPVFQTITTQVPQPLITSRLAQNGGRGFDAENGNYTTEATDAEVDTVGPALEIVRDYNSRDPRVTGAFGAAWSSVVDARAVEQYDTSGGLTGVHLTYPDGSTVGYGKNVDGSFSVSKGRFASFTAVTGGGYRLVDKNDTTYTFTQPLGSGGFGIGSIADAGGRALNFTWSGGRITTMTSATSGRALHLTWATPAGAAAAHVSRVATDPVTAGDPDSANVWTYTYSGDRLTGVCSPVSTTACTTYGYSGGSLYHNQVLDQGAESYWPLAEASGTTAASAVLANEGVDNATYANVTLGQAGPLAGGSAKAAGFNGTTSQLKLPRNVQAGTTAAESISMWFKTTTANSVLFSYQHDPVDPGDTTVGDYMPALYIGNDGKVHGKFWDSTGTADVLSSPAAVTDGNWHQVVLTANGAAQWLYLDGALVGSKTGLIRMFGMLDDVVGAGYLGGKWPNQNHYSTTDNTGHATFFKGTIGDVAFFDKTLTQANVTGLREVGTRAATLMTSITRPSGKAFAAVTYDPVTASVRTVTDEQGGSWNVAAPTVTGSSQVYRAAVLGAAPATYYRMGEAAGATEAVDEVNAGGATYANVTLGADGPFEDATAASFNGTSSYVQPPRNNKVLTDPGSVELWFKMPSGNTAGGVLYGQQDDPLPSLTQAGSGYVPALYIGTDGKLHGKFWDANGSSAGMTSTGKVNDGGWHHVVLSAASSAQDLYLDGVKQGSLTAALESDWGNAGAGYTYIGAGEAGGDWPNHPTNTLGWFPGSIADVSFYRGRLSAEQVTAHYAAAGDSGGLAPLQEVRVTDPGGKVITHQYDMDNGGRQIALIDGLGHRTTFGYDASGFQHTITDPNGNVDITGHDVRGNEVSTTTCQNHATNTCSTSYFTYFPDATTTQLPSDPRNDLLLTSSDGRSSGPADATYRTTYAYDGDGNRTGVTTPAVPGFPAGRTTTVSYTDGTTVAAADSGFAPAGLPYRTVSPGDAVTTITYFRTGDVASVTDPAGLVTRFTYDALGRVLGKTEVSDTYPGGVTTSYAYDRIDQLVQETEPAVTNRITGAVHTPRTTTVFDDDGNPTSQTVADLTGGDASRAMTTIYDLRGRPASTTDALGKTTSYTYDAYGNQATETDPAGVTMAFTYDANGQQLTQTLKNHTGDPNDPRPAQDLVEESRAYDPAGRLASVTDSMGNTTTYTYTDNDLLVRVKRTDPTGQQSFVQQETSYDAAGNPISQASNNGATTATSAVDAANRVTSTTVDPTGVARTTKISYTPDDQVATSTVMDEGQWPLITSYGYDDMGRMTKETVGGDGPGRPAGWWRLNQASGTTVTDASGTGNTASAVGVTWPGTAAKFTGTTGQRITTNGPVLNTAQSYSVSAWVRLDATSATKFQTAVGQEGTNCNAFYLQYNGPANKWSFSQCATDTVGGTGIRAQSTTSPTVGTWAHLVGVYNSDDTSMTLYVNGTAEGSAANPTPFNATGPLTMGRARYNATGTDLLTGAISNVQVYQRALPAADVTKLYGNGREGGTTGSWSSATTKWVLDQRGLPTSQVDAKGNTTNYTHDEAGQPVLVSAPSVNVETGGGTPVLQHPIVTTGYDTFGDPTEQQDANGNTTITEYDAEGQRVRNTMPGYTPPGSSTPITASAGWAYDGNGNVTEVTDPLGRKTNYVYDQMGDVAKITNPAGGVTKFTYDTNGDRLSTTSPGGAQSQATYDFLGRQLTSTTLDRYPTATAATTTYAYTASSANPGGAFLSSETSPSGIPTTYGYNRVGENTKVTDAAGALTVTSYDALGRKSRVTLADGTKTKLKYDTLGNLVQVDKTGTDGTTVLASTAATYNAVGHQMSTTDANGHTTRFIRDALGQITSLVQPVTATTSITTTFGYDAEGDRTRFTDGRGNSWIYGFNTWGMPESVLEPATATYTSTADRRSTIAYDAAGRPVGRTLPGGVTMSAGYDDLDNLTSQSGSGADAATADRTFTYDGEGRMLTAETAAIGTTVPATSESFTYNDRGLLLSASGSGGASSFAYNADALLTSRTDAAGTTNYGYDSAGRLSTIADPATGTTLTHGYDQLSQLTSVQYGSNGNSRGYTYDQLHRLTGDTLKTAGGGTIASISYGYDANGNETSKTTTGLSGATSNTYAYDWANRLISWNDGTTITPYEYDASGNRTRIGANVYTYDARDQLTGDGNTGYAYTARGTLATQTTGGSTVDLSSDAYGQQITASGGNGETKTYLNDALGRVITATGPGGGNTFSYSGAANTVASDGVNTYTWDPGDALVGIGAQGGGTGTGVLALTDLHDDVIANFTATGATLTGSRTYDPLGNVKADSGGLAGRLGYQSGWTDETTERVNMGSRWYNPTVGQFQNKDTISVDPVPNPNAANPFAYVSGNPMIGTDADGHCSWWDAACKAREAWQWAQHKAWLAWRAAQHKAWLAWKAGQEAAARAAAAAKARAAAVRRAASRAVHHVRRAVHRVADAYHRAVKRVRHYAHRAAQKVRKVVKHAVHKVKTAYRKVSHKVSNAARAAGRLAAAAGKKAAAAAKKGAAFVKHHAATIASVAVSTVVFIGCEAALGVATGGVGAVAGAAACGALAGAAGSMVEQGAKCMQGQKGACSAGAFVKSAVIGGVTGAVGGLTGGAGGALLKAALGKTMPRLVTAVVDGAVEGAATGGVSYGLSCEGSCSWVGAARAAGSGAKGGAVGLPSRGRSGGPRKDGTSPKSDAAPGGSCSISSRTHSFTAATPVLMADGSAKPISQVKVGDKVTNAVPGANGKTETHTVDAVIVTTTDRNFVDLTIATKGKDGRPASVGRLTTTDNHPFYDITQAAFVDAAKIKAGDELQQADGSTAVVLDIRRYETAQTTYDLTINGLHTYYVETTGGDPVLVHNCTPVDAANGPPGVQMPMFTLDDGELATAAQMAASTPGGGTRVGQAGVRQQLLARTDAPYQCHRCGMRTSNEDNVHLGHVNVPTSRGGNLADVNVCLEGAACNLSAGNRGRVKVGRSCAERGSCGAPYGRTD